MKGRIIMKNRSVNIIAGGGGTAEPVAERHPHLNPSECTTNMTKAWTGYRTTKNLNKTASQPTKLRGPVDPGFTMAEILLSLTIIGVVAAITLPSLTGNINERTWNTQRKALYARFSQAIALMPALNGYGTTNEDATETFVASGLSKVLKINNICDSDHLEDCGFASKIMNATGSPISLPKLSTDIQNSTFDANGLSYPALTAAAFETANGESVLAFYNRDCQAFDIVAINGYYTTQSKMCVNFVYDLNGNKGPNTFGKDIGIITAFYPTDSVVVAPYPHIYGGEFEVDFAQANSTCKHFDSEYRAPNREEMMSLLYSGKIAGTAKGRYWTSSRINSSLAWVVSLTGNILSYHVSITGSSDPDGITNAVRCVKR